MRSQQRCWTQGCREHGTHHQRRTRIHSRPATRCPEWRPRRCCRSSRTLRPCRGPPQWPCSRSEGPTRSPAARLPALRPPRIRTNNVNISHTTAQLVCVPGRSGSLHRPRPPRLAAPGCPPRSSWRSSNNLLRRPMPSSPTRRSPLLLRKRTVTHKNAQTYQSQFTASKYFDGE